MKTPIITLLILFAPATGAAAQSLTEPVQFVAVEPGKAWFIERATGPSGIKDLHDFWVVGVGDTKLPDGADRAELQLALPCDRQEFVHFGSMLWRGEEIVGGDAGGLMQPQPVNPGSTHALLRAAVCGQGPAPSGPLLNTVAEMRAAGAKAAATSPAR